MTGPFPARHVFLPALVLAAGLALPAPARAAANPGDDARNKGAEETVKDEAKTDDKKAVWSELDSKSNVNSCRRNLQRKHLTTLVNLVVQSDPAQPEDARTLARADLIQIRRAIDAALGRVERPAVPLDAVTRAHLDESRARITAALEAGMQRQLPQPQRPQG